MSTVKIGCAIAQEAVKNTSQGVVTYNLNTFYGGTPTIGGPHTFSSTLTSDYVTALWFDNYDTSLLDNYEISSFTLQILAFILNIEAGVELCILPSTLSRNASAETIYNTVKSLTPLLSNPSTVVSNSKWLINITDRDTMAQIINSGIGLRHISSTLSRIFSDDESTYIVMEYGDTIAPATVEALSPKNRIIVGNENQTFTWSFAQDANQAQTHYDLQYSSDNGATWTTYANKVASANHECVVTGGTLSSGTYYWRVRAYTQSGTVVSSWSQATVTVQTNASTSGVSCNGKPMPTVTWTASDQAAYQVKIGDDYDSGTVYSTTGSHRPARYFADNAYAITVRTQTSLGVWSAWTELLYVNIANTPGADILLSTYQSGYGVGLTWVTDGNYDNYYVLRDGVPIGTTVGATFTDALTNGAHTYSILAPRSGGNYTMSNDSLQNVSLPFDIISTVDKLEWLPLKYALGSPITREYSESEAISYRYFAGRKHPVAFVAEQESNKVSLKYGFELPEEVEAIRALKGAVVVFKDRRGNRIIGMIDNINRSVGKYIDLSMSITQVDYNEEVAYDTNYPAS